MSFYEIHKKRIKHAYHIIDEFPFHFVRSDRAWHSLLAERHTGKRSKKSITKNEGNKPYYLSLLSKKIPTTYLLSGFRSKH